MATGGRARLALGGGTGTCPMGTRGCLCYASNLCATPTLLTCVTGICCTLSGDCSQPTSAGGAGGETSSITAGGTNASVTGGGRSIGGNNAAGGISTTGGTASTGGTKSTGGDTATGGVTGTGGTSIRSMGGATPVATGGTKATGGTTSAIATGGAVSTGGAATGGSAAAGCPGTGGPSMVMLPQGYCIDSTEVTRDQYAAWLATTPALPASSDANCGWKSSGSYAADATCMTGGNVCEGAACGNHPQVCVDWCDAYAYCGAVGKRLCGKIGGGSNTYSSYADATTSQWFRACSSGGPYTYPYGSAYQARYCNGYDYLGSNNKSLPVATLTTCQSSISDYVGVYDLSGNVWEWEDSCNGAVGQTDLCRLRGGSFNEYGDVLQCSSVGAFITRGDGYYAVGFRCCSP